MLRVRYVRASRLCYGKPQGKPVRFGQGDQRPGIANNDHEDAFRAASRSACISASNSSRG